MDRSPEGEGREARFASYVEHMASAQEHADRRTPFRSYCAGLILPGERKSIELIAARLEPRRVQGLWVSGGFFDVLGISPASGATRSRSTW